MIAARVLWKDNSVRRLAQEFGYSGIVISQNAEGRMLGPFTFSGEIDDILNVMEKLNAKNQGREVAYPKEGWMFDIPGPSLHELGPS